MELKQGCDSTRTLFYLSKAVEMNNYDESALVIRSKCYFILGRNDEAVKDALDAVTINPHNAAAKEALAVALYANGQFEKALVYFHRLYRKRSTAYYSAWVKRCEETIRSYLTCSKLEQDIIEQLLDRNLLNLDLNDQNDVDDTSNKLADSNVIQRVLQKNMLKSKKKLVTQRMNSQVMGKMDEDMMFLDMLSSHPALERSLSTRGKQHIDGVIQNPIQGAAKEGYDFLTTRKNFWESSESIFAKSKRIK